MTIARRDGKPQSSFSRWVQANPSLDSIREGLSLMDIDWIIHQFREPQDTIGKRQINNIMFVEEKSHLADLSPAERDTMYIIEQLCRDADKQRRRFETLRRDKVIVRWFGYHKLQYAGADIAVSPKIIWDKTEVTLATLEEILRFDRNPRTLHKRDDRRHHTSRQTTLFP